MINKLYKSNVIVNGTNKLYEKCVEIKDLESFKFAVEKDHVSAEMINNTRSGENFISSNILMVDFDNETEDESKWIDINKFQSLYKDYKYYIATSKSHSIWKIRPNGVEPKAGDSPRPRFHAYFLLGEDLIPSTYPHAEKIKGFFKVADTNAMDRTRLFYGNPDSEVYYNEGCGSNIIDGINKVIVSLPSPKVEYTGVESNLTDRAKKETLYYLGMLDKNGFFGDRLDWVALGTALKTSGFEFDDWMELSNEDVIPRKEIGRWNGLKEGEHTLGTIIFWIQNNIHGLSGWLPERERDIDIVIEDVNEDGDNIVDVDLFVETMNSKWVKTTDSRDIVYHNLTDQSNYKWRAISSLYGEYIYNVEDDKFKSAFEYWDKSTSVVKSVRRSPEKDGFEIDVNGEKTRWVKDETMRENFSDFISTDELQDYFLAKKNDTMKRVKSSYRMLQLNLDKGYKEGYVYCFNALSGIGKTWMMLNEAVNIAMRGGDKVLYVSTEMNKEKILDRVLPLIYDDPNIDSCGIKFIQDRREGNNPLKNFGFMFADRGMDTNSLYEQIKDVGYDLIVIDYLDDFEPTRTADVDYKKHRIIAEDFTELAVRLKAPVITATQSNRSDSNEDGSSKKNRGFSSIGDGYQKTHKMAAIWNMVKVSDEVDATYRGLVSMKNRDIPNAPDCHFSFKPSGRLVDSGSAPTPPPKQVSEKTKANSKSWSNKLDNK